MITNGLIVVVNFANWTKGRSLMPNDEILTSLGLSNLFFSTTIVLDYFISFLWREFYNTFVRVQKIMFCLDIATSFASFWFTAWLSVFYCMKIINFKQPFLAKVKLKFSGLVRWLLLGSVLFSLGSAVLLYWAFWKASLRFPSKGPVNQTISLPSDFNQTLSHERGNVILVHMTLSYKLLIILLGCFAPFAVVISSSIPVLKSLFRHIQRLEQNASVFHNPRLEAHLNASKALLSLLLSYCSLYVSEIVVRAEIFPNWTSSYFLCLTTQLATLAVQASTLILSNQKLKQSVVQFLPCMQSEPAQHHEEFRVKADIACVVQLGNPKNPLQRKERNCGKPFPINLYCITSPYLLQSYGSLFNPKYRFVKCILEFKDDAS
ncbi:taste receptor type 2 member 40-like [Hemicordylus capensis]|uniref:taste receptor type 2 member 40-like n=1 Tax=Hemicordylus capensis TaxID=884348 RepID=UPI0023021007|nr:taste receptor type 2 member 40-like [Hemicordylus capensis]